MRYFFSLIILSSLIVSCQVLKSQENTFGGVGISVLYDSSASLPYIVQIISGSPAAMSGLRSGDYIMDIDKKDVTKSSIENILHKLRGKQGTSVEIKVKRLGQMQKFNLTRAKIQAPPSSENFCFALDSLLIYMSNEKSDFEKTEVPLPGFYSGKLNSGEWSGIYYICKDSFQAALKMNELKSNLRNCLTYICCEEISYDCNRDLHLEACQLKLESPISAIHINPELISLSVFKTHDVFYSIGLTIKNRD